MSQYAIKNNNNPNNNIWDKKGDKSKKDDDAKSEDKDDNTTGTKGAQVGKATLDKDKTVTLSNSSSIGAHVSDIANTVLPLPQHVQDILASYPVDNPILDQAYPYDLSIDTINSVEDLARAHFMDLTLL